MFACIWLARTQNGYMFMCGCAQVRMRTFQQAQFGFRNLGSRLCTHMLTHIPRQMVWTYWWRHAHGYVNWHSLRTALFELMCHHDSRTFQRFHGGGIHKAHGTRVRAFSGTALCHESEDFVIRQRVEVVLQDCHLQLMRHGHRGCLLELEVDVQRSVLHGVAD